MCFVASQQKKVGWWGKRRRGEGAHGEKREMKKGTRKGGGRRTPISSGTHAIPPYSLGKGFSDLLPPSRYPSRLILTGPSCGLPVPFTPHTGPSCGLGLKGFIGHASNTVRGNYPASWLSACFTFYRKTLNVSVSSWGFRKRIIKK